ncbi:hypothetical protein E4O03_03580 [Treponema sp. OMZ 792]|uniref:hypothetical protein n=1 Tax=unclassified Treponema TaxID=2638727 RepID=UPI0020A27D0C|nr:MULTISPECIES: hypothetical protein [unclassified Treponema]UTC75812.1 hypothetical protein E4O03_03580 [Treponema sp. OMZ 792]UTC78692.1 hypothetical protein E4O04_12095 [Treponema sp. OMZ 799]UTC79812.1 hypothetical protein E4O07_03590 [Treponema sp. OMZ 798]
MKKKFFTLIFFLYFNILALSFEIPNEYQKFSYIDSKDNYYKILIEEFNNDIDKYYEIIIPGLYQNPNSINWHLIFVSSSKKNKYCIFYFNNNYGNVLLELNEDIFNKYISEIELIIKNKKISEYEKGIIDSPFLIFFFGRIKSLNINECFYGVLNYKKHDDYQRKLYEYFTEKSKELLKEIGENEN